jgi:hypothetical protein
MLIPTYIILHDTLKSMGNEMQFTVFQVSGRTESRFGYGRYLLNPSQFIIHPLPYHSTLCSSSTESVVP